MAAVPVAQPSETRRLRSRRSPPASRLRKTSSQPQDLSMKIRLHTFAAAAGLILTARSAAAGDLPDPNLTPGVARPDVTAADLCPVAHTPGLRNVPQSEKMAVYRAYGILPHQGYCAVE